MKKKIELMMAVVLIMTAIYFSQSHIIDKIEVLGPVKAKNSKTLVIDAGHGGSDPGKIGIHGEQEKNINLQIAIRLKKLLESQGYEIVLTRENEAGLGDTAKNNKKAEDMRRRCEIIEKANPVCTISIHQNSYPEESIHGAQVFYYGQSQMGAELANKIQNSMVKRLDPDNHRVEKANESYYLLKKTANPTVIVECGFLSNEKEAELLTKREYQNDVAWSIMMGVIQFLSEE